MERQGSLNKVHRSSETNKTIKVTDLTVRYQGKTALDSVSLTIKNSAITGIIGPNGAGKSTFIKGVMGLVPTVSGKSLLGQDNVLDHKRDIAYVEQRSMIDLSFPITVEEVVLLGTYPKLGVFRRPKQAEREKVRACLELVKMSEFKTRQIGELSGGQLQRVFIARALAQEASVIFLDEPFVGIDMSSERVIVDILKELKTLGKTIVIVHHDLHKVTEYFDELIVLNKQLIGYGPVEEVFNTTTIQKAYGDTLGDIRIKGVE